MALFSSSNSIEPVEVDAAAARARAARRPDAQPPEATAAGERRQATAAPGAEPAKAAAAEGGWNLFRRKAAEAAQPDAVAQQHGLYVAEKRGVTTYYADYRQKEEVMRAEDGRITSKLDSKAAVTAMLDLAQDKGWQTVRLRGTQDFQREAWVQAQVRGVEAQGYKPTDTDRQEVERRTLALEAVRPAVKENEVAKSAPAEQPAAVAKAGDKAVPVAQASEPSPAPEKPPVDVQQPGKEKEATKAAPAEQAAAVPQSADKAVPAAQASAMPPASEKSALGSQPRAPNQRRVRAEVRSAQPAVRAGAAEPAAVKAKAADGARPSSRAERTQAVWGNVENAGKQARATETSKQTATAKAGERSSPAATA